MRATQLPLVTTSDTVFVLFTDDMGVVRLGRTLPTNIASGEAALALATANAAQSTANTALANAATAQSTANTAITNAAAALAAATAARVIDIIVPVSDETTSITTGIAKVTFRVPRAITLTAVKADLTTTSSGGTPTIDIKESGVSILSTLITIDAGQTSSVNSGTQPVISDSALANNAQITIDITVAGTGAKGLKVTLSGTW